MLQRIYGTPFRRRKTSSITSMFWRGQKRDHRKLGKELDLFSIVDEAGPGLVICILRVHCSGILWKILNGKST